MNIQIGASQYILAEWLQNDYKNGLLHGSMEKCHILVGLMACRFEGLRAFGLVSLAAYGFESLMA